MLIVCMHIYTLSFGLSSDGFGMPSLYETKRVSQAALCFGFPDTSLTCAVPGATLDYLSLY